MVKETNALHFHKPKDCSYICNYILLKYPLFQYSHRRSSKCYPHAIYEVMVPESGFCFDKSKLPLESAVNKAKDEVLCTTNREDVYIFGFTGGLLEVDGVKIEENKYLDYTISANWNTILVKKGTATIPSPIIGAISNVSVFLESE